jgi:hypothetical protein
VNQARPVILETDAPWPALKLPIRIDDFSEDSGVLTEDAVQCPETAWHAALTRPLPDDPEAALLDLARQWVLLYVDWVTGDLALRAPPNEVAYAIELGARRLRQITLANAARICRRRRAYPAADPRLRGTVEADHAVTAAEEFLSARPADLRCRRHPPGRTLPPRNSGP